ncbi:MAG: NTP transferase domain-containing protein, partial [Candidatus Diapherotrites archaeon]|nr:NTP transferase domain-containing protein [Candidatus Diapherotrites archaeon]
MQAIILAAGKGLRMRPLTENTPKPLLPVANKPIIQHQLEALQGIASEAIIVVGYLSKQIKERLGNEFNSMKLTYVEQEEQKGTGHAMQLVKDRIKSDFMLLMGDDLYNKEDVRALAKEDAAMLVGEVPDPQHFGIITVKEGRVTGIEEKPANPSSSLVNTGCYHLPKEMLEELSSLKESPRGELEFTDAVLSYAKKKQVRAVKALLWLPIPFPHSLLKANEEAVKRIKGENHGTVEDNVVIKGEVIIGEGTTIKSGSYIEGPCVIGKNTIIGPFAHLRAFTSIGDGCFVGRSEVKNSIIMDGTKIPHFSYIGDSVTGKDCNFGAGSKVANLRFDDKSVGNTGRRKMGCIMGDGTKLGINSSIMPGVAIGSKCLVGSGV